MDPVYYFHESVRYLSDFSSVVVTNCAKDDKQKCTISLLQIISTNKRKDEIHILRER